MAPGQEKPKKVISDCPDPPRITLSGSGPCPFITDGAVKNQKPGIIKKTTQVNGKFKPDSAPVGPEQSTAPISVGSWEDYHIFLTADDTCRIKTPDGEKRYTFAELGMSDKRKGDSPRQLWELMTLFATTGGCITGTVMARYNGGRGRKFDFQTATKQLNKHLQAYFGIKESIFTDHYKKNREYRTKMKFHDRRENVSTKET